MSIVDSQKLKVSLEKSEGRILMFADGFVDEVWEIVDARKGPYDYTLYNQVSQFAERILKAGSGGMGLELIKKRRTFGGFTANIGYAAARLGVDTTMIGVFGEDGLDPSFVEVGELCCVISVNDPAITHVFEFGDGKLLMSHMEAVQNLSWDYIVDKVGLDKVVSLIRDSDIIGVGYWSLLPCFDEIVEKVCEHLPQDGKSRRFFYDFADLHKKDVSSLKSTLELLKRLSAKVPMSLSLNEHEAAAIFGIYDETLDDVGKPLQVKLEDVRKQLGLDELIVHDPHFGAAACSGEEPAFVKARYCTNLVRSAGAGDNFNGGYISARLAGLNITERLYVANATVGHFIRTGVFPTVEDMINQMNSTED
jgi:sugar/nucleoside kinase (ribokinase family)